MKKIYALLFTTIMLLTACQPTPEKEVVVPRDNTEKVVAEAAKKEQESVAESEAPPVFIYETPEHISERFNIVDGVMDVMIEADVNMPDIQSVPVAKIKSCPFTQERADELREYFMKDGRLVTQHVRTKTDYDAMIIEAKRGHEVDGEMVLDESSQRWIEQLLEEREKAPDEDVANTITDYSIDGEDGLSGTIVINGEEKGSLYAKSDTFGYNSGGIWRTDESNTFDDDGNLIVYPTIEINMTEEEAVQVVYDMLEDLGISGMAVKEMYKAYLYGSFDDYADRVAPETGGYKILLMRELGGMMPIYLTGLSIGREDKFEVSPPFAAEYMDVIIDDMGKIYDFSWRNPVEITEVMTEHVDILPFEDIMERFRAFAKIQWSYMEGRENEIKWLIKVSGIELNLVYLPMKNNPTEVMYAPCWAFAYKHIPDYTDEQKAEMIERGAMIINEEEYGTEYLIFSAVDGASVSPYSSELVEEVQRMREEHDQG